LSQYETVPILNIVVFYLFSGREKKGCEIVILGIIIAFIYIKYTRAEKNTPILHPFSIFSGYFC